MYICPLCVMHDYARRVGRAFFVFFRKGVRDGISSEVVGIGGRSSFA